MILTPSGRFIENNKICLSNSSYHSEEWSPNWTIRGILIGFLSIMLDDKEHGISHIHYGSKEQMRYAKESIEYNKSHHPKIIKRFTRFLDENGNPRKEEKKEVKEEKKEVKTEKKEVKTEKKEVKKEKKEVKKEKKKVPVKKAPVKKAPAIKAIKNPRKKRAPKKELKKSPKRAPKKKSYKGDEEEITNIASNNP
jgi:hypothetical protein